MNNYKKVNDSWKILKRSLAQFDNQSKEEIWNKCDKGDWLLWLASQIHEDRKMIAFAACQCVRLVLKHIISKNSLDCLKTIEKWCRNEAAIEEIKQAKLLLSLYCDPCSIQYFLNNAIDCSANISCYDDVGYYSAQVPYYVRKVVHIEYGPNSPEAQKISKECADIVRKYIKISNNSPFEGCEYE